MTGLSWTRIFIPARSPAVRIGSFVYRLRSPWVKPPSTVSPLPASSEVNNSPLIAGSVMTRIWCSMLSNTRGRLKTWKSLLRFSIWGLEMIARSTIPLLMRLRISCCAPSTSLANTSMR